MVNIIRCVLPTGVKRFKAFTVADYRDFLLLRNHMMTLPEEEHQIIIDELLEDLFQEYPKAYREYIFLKVFSGSTGSTKIHLSYTCPICGHVHPKILNIAQEDFVEPSITLGNVTLKFKIPEEFIEDTVEMVLTNINEVVISGETYKWADLGEEYKDQIINAIDLDTVDKIVSKLRPINFKVNFHCKQTEECKEKTKRTVVYDNVLSVFKLLINPEEIFSFYDINHTLNNSNYEYSSVMSMSPAERSMILSFIERDKRQQQ